MSKNTKYDLFELYLSCKCTLEGHLDLKKANFEEVATKSHILAQNITLSFDMCEKSLCRFSFFFSLFSKRVEEMIFCVTKEV